MNNIFNPAVREAIKEALRLIVLGLIAWAITLVSGQEGEVFLIVTTLLRAVDKWIHEHPNKFNGLLPF